MANITTQNWMQDTLQETDKDEKLYRKLKMSEICGEGYKELYFQEFLGNLMTHQIKISTFSNKN